MADRILFAGGGIETVRTVSGTIGTDTSSGNRNTTYSDHAVSCNNANIAAFDFVNSSGAADSAVTGETLSFSMFLDFGGASFSTVGSYIEVYDSSNFPWLAFRCTGSTNTGGWYYNSGTGASPVWTQIGTETYTWSNGSNAYFEATVTLGSPHTFAWTVDEVSIASGKTFTQASFTNARHIRGRSPHSTSNSFSEVIAAVGYSMVGAHVYYGKPTGAGANSGWSGTSADIDDQGINDVDAISSGTAGQRSTFAYGDVPTLTANQALGDIFLWTRARNSGGSPSNVKPVYRDSGGTDNVGSAFSGITGGYQNFLTRYPAITEAQYNASQFGVESAA